LTAILTKKIYINDIFLFASYKCVFAGKISMKLSHRLAIIVGCAALGILVISAFGLSALRTNIVNERRAALHTLLVMVKNQIEYYHDQEKTGKLTREQAQTLAIENLKTLRAGNTSYVWVRTTAALGLVLAIPSDVGKVSFGQKLPDGRYDWQLYLDALNNTDFGTVNLLVKHPKLGTLQPKINGVVKIDGWDWVVGCGVWLDDVNSAFWSMAYKFLGIGLFVLAIVIALATIMARRIYGQLGGEPDYAATAAQKISMGGLNQQMEYRPGNNLLASMVTMQESLRKMIGTIQQDSHELDEAASNLTGQMEQIDKASQQSSAATSSTAAGIEELAVSIDHISASARETEANSTRSGESAANGEKMVTQAANTIEKVSGRIAEASTQIEGLRDRSNQIGGIAGVIKEIADQTNLLALNAAIEAARAGEQGRGFAVVADEVRKLAERTTQATEQITTMIDGIQNDTSSVVASMQTVMPLVAQGVEMAGNAASALREINLDAKSTQERIREVAYATAEQSQASTSVAQNVERIAHMVEESASSVRAANADVQTLKDLAGRLRSTVAHFQL
jgi:methyl-accepting chemotaxis protein